MSAIRRHLLSWARLSLALLGVSMLCPYGDSLYGRVLDATSSATGNEGSVATYLAWEFCALLLLIGSVRPRWAAGPIGAATIAVASVGIGVGEGAVAESIPYVFLQLAIRLPLLAILGIGVALVPPRTAASRYSAGGLLLLVAVVYAALLTLPMWGRP